MPEFMSKKPIKLNVEIVYDDGTLDEVEVYAPSLSLDSTPIDHRYPRQRLSLYASGPGRVNVGG